MAVALRLPRAVEASLEILRSSPGSSRRGDHTEQMEDRVSRLVATLEELGAKWALVGAHAVGMFTEPRATVDFDFIVEEGRIKALVERLEGELGDLGIHDLGPGLRLTALDVDLIRSTTHPLFQEALHHVHVVEGWKVPVPEVLLVLKFLAATSPWRGRAKQTYDVADMQALFHAVGKDHLDRGLMTRLAALVYPRAEREFEDRIQRIERGDPITV